LLIPKIEDEARREQYVASVAEAYELIVAAIERLEKTEPKLSDFSCDFWLAEREHRQRLQALRDVRDQCEMLSNAPTSAT